MENNNESGISTEIIQSISSEIAWHYQIIPFVSDSERIEFYIDQKSDIPDVIDELEILTGKKVRTVPMDTDEIRMQLSRYYRKKILTNDAENKLTPERFEDFLDNLINEAHQLKSSDIHIEKYEEFGRIRLRIDGKLIERNIIKSADYPVLVNKIKILSNLDIAEKRLPQDGRIYFKTDNNTFDIRVSILPSLYGEKIVLRLLSKDSSGVNLHDLGLSRKQEADYLEGIKKPNGIILISGPTGSGKTTTLYATLKILNNDDVNVLTIEDPIEYTLEGINQVQVKDSIGLSYASALRTFLRQDPDIIMLGEIRDTETAQMAIRAALTGHLVLSTIHTNSAWGTISRLIDMGIPGYLIANTLNLTVSQRLLRLLCKNCKASKNTSPEEFPKHFPQELIPQQAQYPVGCEKCYYTGYSGRTAVYEVITIDMDFIDSIKFNNHDVSELRKKKDIVSLFESAYQLIKTGKTSIEEAYPILLTNNQ